jgi:hypothetical protein
MLLGCLGGRREREDHGTDEQQEPTAADAKPAHPAGATQLSEQQGAPQDSQQPVRVPEWERDGEPHVVDGVNGQGVRHRPETTCEQRPDDEVRRAREIRPYAGGSSQQRRQAPAREEHAHHHHERDRHRRDAERHELGRCLGRTEPGARRDAGEDAHRLETAQPRRA